MCEGCCNFAKFKFSEGFLLGRTVAQQGSFAKPANLAQIAVPEPRPGLFGCCFRCGWGRWLAHGASRAPTFPVRVGMVLSARHLVLVAPAWAGLGAGRRQSEGGAWVTGAGEEALPQYDATAGHAVGHPRCGSAGGLRGARCCASDPPSTTRAGWPSRLLSNLVGYFSRVPV